MNGNIFMDKIAISIFIISCVLLVKIAGKNSTKKINSTLKINNHDRIIRNDNEGADRTLYCEILLTKMIITKSLNKYIYNIEYQVLE